MKSKTNPCPEPQTAERITSMKKLFKFIPIACCALALAWGGCATKKESEAPPPKRDTNEGTVKTELVALTKIVPASTHVGQTFEYHLRYMANQNLESLTITDRLPEGLTFVKSEPAATADGGNLTWILKDVDKGQGGTITVTVKADHEGTLAGCATITAAIPRVCVATFVGRAVLSVEKTGPETVVIASDVTYKILVKNSGSLAAENVVVTDTIPEGMTPENGQRTMAFNVGTLPPNGSKEITVTLRATTKGKQCNTVKVTSSNTGEAEAQACTTVIVPSLKLEKTGDKEQALNRNAVYNIKVTNTGETALNGVTVVDTAPVPTRITEAEGASVSGDQATWNVGTLQPGESRTVKISITSKDQGTFCNKVSAYTAEKAVANAESCTRWRGFPGLLFEEGDNPDPIQVGSTTTYTVRVTNQGDIDDTNLKVVVEFPDELTPVSASNDGAISGKTVTFKPYPLLHPKQSFEYNVIAKGVKAGDARVKFIRTSDGIPAPTTAEESTHVY
jgi:uncharacterized repeat protein (TIGR01451 family)/fimbrial isopeptide formation D2 family protein